MSEGRRFEVKSTELIGLSLNWAVAQACGVEVGIICPAIIDENNKPALLLNKAAWLEGRAPAMIWSPSTDWSQGGPLLDQHCKGFGCAQDQMDSTWRAFGYGSGDAFDPNRQMRLASGASILIAACRAIVTAKLGDVVLVPPELVGGEK